MQEEQGHYSPQRSRKNMTSIKQQSALRPAKEDFYYQNRERQFEQGEAIGMEKSPNDHQLTTNLKSITQYRTSMKKQVELWNHSSALNTLKTIAEDYYSQNLTLTTADFLQNMRQVALQAEDKVRQKRKQIIGERTVAIRKQWQNLEKSLHHAVSYWCKLNEQRQLTNFIENDRLLASEPLAELADRLASKREEIEMYASRVRDLHLNNSILRQEELTRHIVKTKDYLKQIWDKHYELELHELGKQVQNAAKGGAWLPFDSEEGTFARDSLHRTIDDVLQPYPPFKQFFSSLSESRNKPGILRKNVQPSVQPSIKPSVQPSPPPTPKSELRKSILKSSPSQPRSVRSERPQIQPENDKPVTNNDIIVQSLISQTMRQLEILRQQRDQQWKMLTKAMIN